MSIVMRFTRRALVFAFLFPALVASAQRGEPVFIYLTDSSVYSGVVLAVDDSVIIMDLSGTPWRSDMAPASMRLKALPIDQVGFLFRDGRSRTGNGALIGLVCGVVTGTLIIETLPEHLKLRDVRDVFNTTLLAVAAVAGCTLLGAVIGHSMGDAQVYIVPSTRDGYLALRNLAVYGDTFPTALRAGLRPASLERLP
jgi:hypothetical protein